MGNQKNQTGFGAVEGILILVIVGMLGFVGWYVYHSNQKTNLLLSAATQDSANAPKASSSAKKSTGTSSPTNQKTNTSTSTNNSSIFKVPELGIEIINIPSTVADLTDYQYASNSSIDPNNTSATAVQFTAVQFSTKSLTKADPGCSAKNGSSIGALARTDGTYIDRQPEDDTLFVKQFNGFYITYSHPQAACSNNSDTESLHQSQTATFENVLTTPADLLPL